MSKICTIVGEVVDGTPQLHHKSSAGESFYKIRVNFVDTEIDVLVSEYNMLENYSGKVAVTGFYASLAHKRQLPKFFFFANEVESADVDAKETDEIAFHCKVSRVGKINHSTSGADACTVYASDYSPLHITSILYLAAKGKWARMLQGKKKGSFVSGTGRIKAFRDVYEIVITDIDEDTDKK